MSVRGFRTEESQKEYKKKLTSLEKKGYSLDSHKWCTYCKDFHSKDAFYANRSKKDGYQVECKVVSFMRMPTYRKLKFTEVLNTFFKENKRLYTSY